MLDLYVCLRPVRYFEGVPSPVKHPEQVDMVIFRENTEDIYAGIEWEADSAEAQESHRLPAEGNGRQENPLSRNQSAIGIKPVSIEGSERLVRRAIQYAIDNKRKIGDPGAQGQHHEVHRRWLQEVGLRAGRAKNSAPTLLDGGPWMKLPNGIVIKDVIADAFLQQILLRPDEYDVIATLNLNGDYISDALAARGRRHRHCAGRQPQLRYGAHVRGHPRHRAQVRRPGQGQPGFGDPVGEMMLRHMGWIEAADLIIASMEKTIAAKIVTYDFARLMEGATEVKCSQFAEAMVAKM